jgi:two-component system cell cycle response regulator DivK
MSKILVAEDNCANRELLTDVLQYYGYEVIEAENGSQALQKLEHTQPDLVVLDIGLPVLDGYAVVQRIRKNSRFGGVKVLALTAYAMNGDRRKALESGFDGYLAKPVDIDILIAEIRRLLGQKTSRTLPTPIVAAAAEVA